MAGPSPTWVFARILVALLLCACAGPEHDEDERAIIAEFNEYRASLGIAAVAPDNCLAGAAHEQAVGLQAMQAYKPGLPRDHSGLDQSEVGERARDHGWRGSYVGEISASGPDPVQSWKDSSGHDAIMRDPVYTHVGVASVGSVTIAVFGARR